MYARMVLTTLYIILASFVYNEGSFVKLPVLL